MSVARASATAFKLDHREDPRGIWKMRGKVLGRNAYYALTSSESIVGNCIYLVSPGVSDAEIVVRLRRALDEAEPRRPQLHVLPREPHPVASAIDGPSPLHPEILELAESGRVLIFPVNGWDSSEPFSSLTTEQMISRLTLRLYGMQSA